MLHLNTLTTNKTLSYKSVFKRWFHILFETENFIAIPSVGALVEGWLLIIPKQPHICIGSMDLAAIAELRGFVKEVKASLESLYGDVVAFEHGPAGVHRPVGCGIDYAHLHLVPFPQTILALARDEFPLLAWSPANGLETCVDYFKKAQDYLYVEDPFEGSFIASGPNIPSQLFRRLIAKKVYRPQKYDWRQYPEEATISATLDRISTSCATPTCLIGEI